MPKQYRRDLHHARTPRNENTPATRPVRVGDEYMRRLHQKLLADRNKRLGKTR